MPARHNFDRNRIRRHVVAAFDATTKEVMATLQRTMRRLLDNEGRGRIQSRTAKGRRIMGRMGLRENQDISIRQRTEILRLAGKRTRAPRKAMRAIKEGRGGRVISFAGRGALPNIRAGEWHSGRGLRADAGIHRVSLPGDPPAKDTGRLLQSTQQAPKRHVRGNARGWRLSLGVRYARWLEWGWPVPNPAIARPFVRPAIDTTVPQVNPIARAMLAKFGLKPR